MKRTPKF